MSSLSPIVVSLGDPCGIGPEIVASAWQAVRNTPDLAFCVLGDANVLNRQGVAVARIDAPFEAREAFGSALPVIHLPLSEPAVPGSPSSAHAPHVIEWIERGVEYCLMQQARALVTAPIAKSVLYEAGFTFPGHTEFLAELCRSDESAEAPLPVMMLTAPDVKNNSHLRVVLATIHTPLAEVAKALTRTHLDQLVRITHGALVRDFALAAPRLVMAGLNPHAGEDGTIGREEVDILRPAVNDLQAASIDIQGPFAADSLFHEDARKGYDAAVCMYHDQGLIPLKTLDFWGGVNITLGLSIVRTSPDHGTGFGIAGKGIARADSFINALRAADEISRNRMAAS